MSEVWASSGIAAEQQAVRRIHFPFSVPFLCRQPSRVHPARDVPLHAGVREYEMSEDGNQQQQDSRDFAQLRARAEAAESQNQALTGLLSQARSAMAANAVRQAGFDPDKGVTNLVVEKYLAELGENDFPTSDGFAEAAKQFGLEPSAATTVGGQHQQQLSQMQSAVDQLNAVSNQADPVGDLQAQIAEAMAAGDVATSMSLKAEWARQLQMKASAIPSL